MANSRPWGSDTRNASNSNEYAIAVCSPEVTAEIFFFLSHAYENIVIKNGTNVNRTTLPIDLRIAININKNSDLLSNQFSEHSEAQIDIYFQ